MTQQETDELNRLHDLSGKVQNMLDSLSRYVSDCEAAGVPLSPAESDTFFQLCSSMRTILSQLGQQLEDAARAAGINV